MTTYHDGSHTYLELHALRAPVGNYKQEYQNDPEAYECAVWMATRQFEQDNNITLWALGRSGRHICIEDTPANRRHYVSLQRKAIKAAKELWANMMM